MMNHYIKWYLMSGIIEEINKITLKIKSGNNITKNCVGAQAYRFKKKISCSNTNEIILLNKKIMTISEDYLQKILKFLPSRLRLTSTL